MKNFSKRLTDLRQSKGLTQNELAELVNVSRSALSLYELGKREPDYETLVRLADFFDVSVDYLLGVSNVRQPVAPSDEVEEILEELHKRPEMKTLFSISRKATKEDIEKAVKIIEALKGDE